MYVTLHALSFLISSSIVSFHVVLLGLFTKALCSVSLTHKYTILLSFHWLRRSSHSCTNAGARFCPSSHSILFLVTPVTPFPFTKHFTLSSPQMSLFVIPCGNFPRQCGFLSVHICEIGFMCEHNETCYDVMYPIHIYFRVIFIPSVMTYWKLILSGYKTKQLWVHVQFMCHYHNMYFTLTRMGLMSFYNHFSHM